MAVHILELHRCLHDEDGREEVEKQSPDPRGQPPPTRIPLDLQDGGGGEDAGRNEDHVHDEQDACPEQEGIRSELHI